MDVLALARELVSIESTTDREGPVGKHIADRLEREGWKVIRQEVSGGDPTLREPRINVFAKASRKAPRLVFTTHIDTVPPYVPLSEDERFLYGRGTCDAKGIFAAQWAAAEHLRLRGRDEVGLLAVVGEETDSIGARRARELFSSPPWIVDGEPTDLFLTSAAKGVLGIRVHTSGVAGHSAYPERGRSALHALLLGLSRLLSSPLPSLPEFGASTVNVGTIVGGAAPNVIAPSAEAQIMVRVAAPLEEVKSAVLRLLGPEVSVEVLTENSPRKIFVPEGFSARPVSFGSDVPYLSAFGRTLLVGPGSIHDAHTSGEKLEKSELLRAVDFYTELGERLLEADPAAIDEP